MDRLPVVALSLFLIVSGIALGYYTNRLVPNEPKVDLVKALQQEISASEIDQYLKHLRSLPHLAGSAEQFKRQADWLREKFLEFGLDHADVTPYRVWLPHAGVKEVNKVYLLDQDGRVRFNTSGWQEALGGGRIANEEAADLITPAIYSAYSVTGTAQGGLVYVYYGRESDFDYVAQQGINVTGHIILARYGATTTFQANLVALAEKRGAAGVILFPDPSDFTRDGMERHHYNSMEPWWTSGSRAGQSPSAGDPLIPLNPSIEGAFHQREDKVNLAQIPVQPVGYKEAEILLRALKETDEAPIEWQYGRLNNVKYYLGPELRESGWKVKLDVKTPHHQQMASIVLFNTIGVLRGEHEPDRYVLVGNHGDVRSLLGALQSSSGTAAMLEMVRSFGRLRQTHGWRPRRSLLFCSWGGAREHGLVGSRYWVEENAKQLAQTAIAYLNVDVAVDGNYTLEATAAPLMHDLLIESSKKIPNPDPAQVAQGRPTLYDTWFATSPQVQHALHQPQQRPQIWIPGRSGSDSAGFTLVLGVPSLHLRYIDKEEATKEAVAVHEHHVLAIDKDLSYHRAVTQLWAEVARNLSESVIVPMDIGSYALHLNQSLGTIKSRYDRRYLQANGVTLAHFEAAVEKFGRAVTDFLSDTLPRTDRTDPLAVRRVNDQLIQLERHFIDPHGLPSRPEYKHVVFAPGVSDSHTGASFAVLTDLLDSVVADQTESKHGPDYWAKIKQHLSVISSLINFASTSLSNLHFI